MAKNFSLHANSQSREKPLIYPLWRQIREVTQKYRCNIQGQNKSALTRPRHFCFPLESNSFSSVWLAVLWVKYNVWNTRNGMGRRRRRASEGRSIWLCICMLICIRAHVVGWQHGDATGEQSEAGLKTLPLHSVLPHPVKTDLSDANVDLSTHVNIRTNKKYLALQLHLKYSVLYVCIHNI